MSSKEITFDISVYKHDSDYYFNNQFVEEAVTKIVDLKAAKVYIDFIEYIEQACKSAEEAYLKAVETKSDVDAPNLIEVTCFGKPVSCLATSFLSRIFNEFGSASMIGENYEDAEESFKKSLEYNAENNLTMFNLANVLFSLNKFEDAVEWCDKIIAIDDKNAPAIYLKALSLSSAGKPEEALPFFIKVAEIDENSIGANFWAGECSLYMKDAETARKHFKRASELSDFKHNDSMRGYAIGELMSDNGDPRVCIEVCDKILQNDALNQIKVYEIKGNAHIKLGEITEGGMAHARLISLEIEATQIAVNTARAIEEKHGRDKMIEYIRVVVTLCPDAMDSLGGIIDAEMKKDGFTGDDADINFEDILLPIEDDK